MGLELHFKWKAELGMHFSDIRSFSALMVHKTRGRSNRGAHFTVKYVLGEVQIGTASDYDFAPTVFISKIIHALV